MQKYVFGKYQFFDFLVFIKRLSNFFEQIALLHDLKQISKLLLDLPGYIWLMQPFCDGNTRTLRFFIKVFFNQMNYNVDLSITDNKLPIIPIFYSENEECSEKDINNLMRRLKKITYKGYFLFFVLSSII